MLVDYYSELSPVEQWFRCQAESLQLLAPLPELSLVQNSLKKHLPKRVERVLPRLANPADTSEWLSLMLKANFLIRLWDTSGKPVLIAINVSGGNPIPPNQLALIHSIEFSAVRRELAIARHWCLTIPHLLYAPSRDELLDALYDQLEVEEECAVVELGETAEAHERVH